MSVTGTPSAENIEAYSMPITLPPTTVIARGTCLSRTTSSPVTTTSPSAATPGGGAGLVPTAITMCAAEIRRQPSSAWTASVCASANERSEEHTSELQSQFHLVCRLLLEKKKPVD